MTNPYLAYEPPGRSRRPMKAKVVRSDADAPMKPTAMEKAQRDKSAQMRSYNGFWAEQRRLMWKGHYTHGTMLMKCLRSMTIDDGDALIDLVKRHRFGNDEEYARQVYLRVIGDRLAQLRVQNGLPPYDDSLPGEDPTVFEIIRAELGVP